MMILTTMMILMATKFDDHVLRIESWCLGLEARGLRLLHGSDKENGSEKLLRISSQWCSAYTSFRHISTTLVDAEETRSVIRRRWPSVMIRFNSPNRSSRHQRRRRWLPWCWHAEVPSFDPWQLLFISRLRRLGN